MAQQYLFSYLAGGLAPVWTKTMEFESETYAVQAARALMRTQAETTAARPLTLLVGAGDDERNARWIGSWRWAPNETWGF